MSSRLPGSFLYEALAVHVVEGDIAHLALRRVSPQLC